MNNAQELISAAAIVIVLLALALYYGWRQWKALRDLRAQDELSLEDKHYVRAQTRRRLIGSVLMVLLAGSLIGTYWSGMERKAGEMIQAVEVGEENADRPPPSAEQRQFAVLYITFWTTFCVILFALLGVVLLDVRANRDFARRHYRTLQNDRRDMIEEEVSRIRSQRNGYG